MLKVVENGVLREAREELSELDEIARVGARRMLIAALETEATDYVERHHHERDESGRALVVHNGKGQARKLTLGAGTVELKTPRVNDRRCDEQGQRRRFTSRILPPYMRRSPKVAEVLPLEDDRLCTLVMIGARPNGEKELLAVEDGYRESAESWKTLLRDLKRRGMAAPVVAVGDGALGFWAAAREVWPETRAQGCWCHKLGNVLDKLPPRLQPRAKRALHEMM